MASERYAFVGYGDKKKGVKYFPGSQAGARNLVNNDI